MGSTNEVRGYAEAELWEDIDGDTHCELKNGFKVTYWEQGLSDLEYIRRTKEI